MIVTALIGVSAFVILDDAESDCSSAQFTDTGRCGDNLTYTLSADGTLVISGNGRMYDYFDNSSPWMKYCGMVTKVVIEDGVTSLGEWAFHGCIYIRELTISGSLNSVRSNAHAAFSGCNLIEKVNITYGTNGSGFDYGAYPVNDCWYQHTPWYQSRNNLKEINFADGIKGIGSDAFRELNITSLVIPDSVTGLGNHTFYKCAKLTDLTYPVSLCPFSDEKCPAFNECRAIQKITFTRGNGIPYDFHNWSKNPQNVNLAPWNMYSDVAKTIVIADNIVEELGHYMFRGCNIKELTVPVSADFYRDAFDGPYGNLEKLTLTKGTGAGNDYHSDNTSIRPWCNVSNIKSITVGEGVTRLGSYMFCNCGVENLVLPNSLVSFGNSAVFKDCTIKNLTIPISLNATWIHEYPYSYTHSAFTGVSGIEKINFTPGSGYGFDYVNDTGSNYAYQNTPWYLCRDTLREINFAEGITRIGSEAFQELHITSLVIPDSVRSLGNHAFYNLAELTSLTVPITIDCVGSTGCPALDKIPNLSYLRFTAGTDGIGYDYADCTPFWNSPPHGLTMIFDSGIKYIGNNTVSEYNLSDTDGKRLEQTAENLSGHVFKGLEPRLFKYDHIYYD